MRRLKVLISAYACEPGRGSEPGVGWNVAREVSKYHEVWVITRSNNRPAIEAAWGRTDDPNLHFVYFDFPNWARWWKRGQRGTYLYYYLWQIGASFVARNLHRKILFDLTHHVTFVKYWVPSLVALLPIPFVWGPVGGGESAPRHLWGGLGLKGQFCEAAREAARWFAERDPLVRLTARRSALALATTEETVVRLRKLGARVIHKFSEAAISGDELCRLSSQEVPRAAEFRFVSIGRLLHWKGFHLGLRAFARANQPHSEYVLIGDGPDRTRLEKLARRLAISDRVHFLGSLSREDTLLQLLKSDVLVHPTLHDSGGWVCLEAMAAGKPVICLELGGPATEVDQSTGIIVPVRDVQGVVEELASAMRRLVADPEYRMRLGQGGRRRITERFLWEKRGLDLSSLYYRVLSTSDAQTHHYEASESAG